MRKLQLLIILISFVFQLNAKQSLKSEVRSPKLSWVQHIEPTYWWTNMHNPDLQIMLHGRDISKCDVSINYPGITITDKKLTDNPNYIFLYININRETNAGFFNIELKNGKKKQLVKYELKERMPNSANRASFTEADNVYLLMPDRFANGNPANDSIKGYIQGVNRSDLGKRHGVDM